MNNIFYIIINSLRLHHHHHHQHYHYFYHQYNLHVLVYLLICSVVECQETCFNNSWYIFSKWGGQWRENKKTCEDQGGYLVSIETEEEWKFINREIQERSSWNTSAWHIGLNKKNETWTWESGAQLNISKWRDPRTKISKDRAEITKNESLFNNIFDHDRSAFICEMAQGK